MSDDITTYGRDELIARMQRFAGTATMTAQVGAASTTGSVQRKRGQVDVSRSAGENVIVLRSQAKGAVGPSGKRSPRRKVDFLAEDEQARGGDIWREAIARFLASNLAAELDAGARRVAEFICEKYREHIERGQAVDGQVAPVLESTQRQKDREVGPGKPPLVRTGQLLRSFLAGVRRG